MITGFATPRSLTGSWGISNGIRFTLDWCGKRRIGPGPVLRRDFNYGRAGNCPTRAALLLTPGEPVHHHGERRRCRAFARRDGDQEALAVGARYVAPVGRNARL